MTRGARAILAGLVAATLVVGCRVSAPPAVTIELRWSRFAPAEVRVPAGQPITFLLENEDPIDHEWIVGDEALHERHRTGTEPAHGDRPTEQSIPALGFVRTTVTFATPGTYAFICHLPGHEAYGMVGRVIVTPG